MAREREREQGRSVLSRPARPTAALGLGGFSLCQVHPSHCPVFWSPSFPPPPPHPYIPLRPTPFPDLAAPAPPHPMTTLPIRSR